MLLFPKNIKWLKTYSRRKKLLSSRNPISLCLRGNFSLVSFEDGKINNKQIESLRRVLRRTLKKQGKIWINPFPQSVITKKPNESRLGKGKGNVKIWACLIRKGEVLVEVKGCHWVKAKEALLKAKSKVSLNTFIDLDKNIFY
mgnify:CR=1 FL=1